MKLSPDLACHNLVVYLLGELKCPLSFLHPTPKWDVFNVPRFSGLSSRMIFTAIESCLDAGEVAESTSPYCHDPVLGLTPSGGARWELITSPRWERCCIGENSEDRASFRSLSRGVIENFLSLGYPWRVKQPIIWTVDEPFEPVYWKSFHLGHRAEFSFIEVTEPTIEALNEYQSRLRWYDWIWKKSDWPFEIIQGNEGASLR